MKIKNFIRPLAAACAAVMVLTASGCGDTSWSFKTEKSTLSNGTWIYQTAIKYQEALSKISEDSESSDSETSVDINNSKIENKNAIDWIYKEAKEACKKQLTIEKLAKDNKVTYDESELDAMESMYKSYYFSMSGTLDELGVSQETFMNTEVKQSFLSNKLFEKLYNKGGSKEVPDEDLKKYFTENYTDYFYIPYSLKTTDTEGNEIDITDDEKDKVKTNFAKYADMLNKDGKTKDDVIEEYKKDFSVDSVPNSSNVAKLDSTGMSDELKKIFQELNDKTATVRTIENSTYLIYKGSITEDAERISDEADENVISRSSILQDMKGDEYNEYIKSEQKTIVYDLNPDCLSKYSIQRTIDILKKIEEQNKAG